MAHTHRESDHVSGAMGLRSLVSLRSCGHGASRDARSRTRRSHAFASGHKDNQRAFTWVENRGDTESVERGHLDVEENDVRSQCPNRGLCGTGLYGANEFDIAVSVQRRRQRRGGARFVLNDERANHAARANLQRGPSKIVNVTECADAVWVCAQSTVTD
jgi:hypothetical protein